MDILKGFIPLPGFGSDHPICYPLTPAQKKLVILQPNGNPGTWHDANFWGAQAAFWGTPTLELSESMSPLVDCVLHPRTWF